MRCSPAPLRALLLCLLLSGCSSHGIESLNLLASLGGFSDRPAPMERRSITLPLGGEERPADLYRRTDLRPKAAMVLVPGVTPEGRNDARLVAFAELLAEARFQVLVPELPQLRDLQVHADDAQDVAEAVAWLAEQSDPPSPVGLTAISYAAGPAFLAALQPETRQQVGFLLAIGGYHDITAVVTYFTTGFYKGPDDDAWQAGEPDPRAPWIFLQANASRLDSASDAAALRAFAEARLQDPQAPVPAGLGPEGGAVLALLLNEDPDAVPALLRALPERLRRDLEDLDLAARQLSRLDLPVLLLHGRDDPVIPASESESLARVLPQAELFLAEALGHVDGAGAARDAPLVLRLIRRVIYQRDRLISHESRTDQGAAQAP